VSDDQQPVAPAGPRVDITENIDRDRYEAHVGGELAGFVNYKVDPGRITLTHTEVADEFEGHGIGSQLAERVLNVARKSGLKVVPQCPFIKKYIEDHAEYQDLVAG
jgi:predicted GNAT family acetyltransferase